MIRMIVLLGCSSALLGGVVQASPVIRSHQVTPESISRYDDRFMVNVQKLDGFMWFEVIVQRPGDSRGGLLAVGVGRSIYTENESVIRVEPSKRGEEWVFKFGLSEAKTADSIFEFQEFHTRYQFDLQAFVLGQDH